MLYQELYQYTKNLRLLYVEDEKSVRDESAELLSHFFKSVTICEDGLEALAYYKSVYYEKNLKFDIVLTDILMPRLNGIDLIKEILTINPKQPICVVSAQDDVSNLIEIINLGINNFILKPLQQKQFVEIFYKMVRALHHEKEAELYRNKMRYTKLMLEDEVEKRTRALKRQLYTDQLTGLQNRLALNRAIEQNRYTMLALVDIDRLQFVNDLYGTEIGNEVIMRFANILTKEIASSGYSLYRTSGDEFAICAASGTGADFRDFIKKLSSKLLEIPLYIEMLDEEIDIDATIGLSSELALLQLSGMIYNSHLLLMQADIALKYAKENKKPFVVYKESMNTLQRMQNIIEWKQRIKSAFETDNIIPVFQPIVDRQGAIVKYEALMRIREYSDGESSLVTPYHFLDIAIMTKQYAKLSQKIIVQVLDLLINTNHTISINLTYSDLKNQNLYRVLIDALKKYPIGERLIFEIVESEDIKDYKIVQKFILRFKKYGVRIAIDDFGSGFSNFENIIKTMPDYIKIDGSLVRRIDRDKNSFAIVKAIVQIAHELNIKVIAEYVHSKEVFDLLKELGVDEFQGFFFYEPSLAFVTETNMV